MLDIIEHSSKYGTHEAGGDDELLFIMYSCLTVQRTRHLTATRELRVKFVFCLIYCSLIRTEYVFEGADDCVDASWLLSPSVCVEVDVADGLKRRQVCGHKAAPVRVDNVDKVGVRRVQVCLRLVVLVVEVRGGWVKS